jgi:hypothetical protein
MIEGSGSGSIPLTNGPGSRRPKNIRIRIRNTACHLAFYNVSMSYKCLPTVPYDVVLMIRVRLFILSYDLDTRQYWGSGIRWTPIQERIFPDPRSPTHISENLVTKSTTYNSLSLAKKFFSVPVQISNNFRFGEILGYKKVKVFPPPLLLLLLDLDLGSEIRDPREIKKKSR